MFENSDYRWCCREDLPARQRSGSVAQVLAARCAPETLKYRARRGAFHLTIVPIARLLTRAKSAPFLEHVSEDFDGIADLREFGEGQRIQMLGERGDAQAASFFEQAPAFGGSADAKAAGIGGIGRNIDQAAARQTGYDAAHGRRLDLLGRGEFLERLWPSEYQDRERGEAGWAFAGSGILLADAAQQVDGGRVQAVGDGEDVGWRNALSATLDVSGTPEG